MFYLSPNQTSSSSSASLLVRRRVFVIMELKKFICALIWGPKPELGANQVHRIAGEPSRIRWTTKSKTKTMARTVAAADDTTGGAGAALAESRRRPESATDDISRGSQPRPASFPVCASRAALITTSRRPAGGARDGQEEEEVDLGPLHRLRRCRPATDRPLLMSTISAFLSFVRICLSCGHFYPHFIGHSCSFNFSSTGLRRRRWRK